MIFDRQDVQDLQEAKWTIALVCTLLQFSARADCAPATRERIDAGIRARECDSRREYVDHGELRDAP